MERTRVWEHVWKTGEAVTDILKRASAQYGIQLNVGNSFPTLNRFAFTENSAQMRDILCRGDLEKVVQQICDPDFERLVK